jgi:hypothetical protein
VVTALTVRSEALVAQPARRGSMHLR